MPAATYPVETIAKLLGLSPRRVQQLSGEGVIPKGERGRYELVPAVRGYIKYLKDRSIGGELAGSDGDKGRLLKSRADIMEMEAREMAGKLVRVDRVESVLCGIASRVKQKVLSIHSKAAPLVAVENSAETCGHIIEKFSHEALAELGDTNVIVEELSSGAEIDVEDIPAATDAEDFHLGGSTQEAIV